MSFFAKIGLYQNKFTIFATCIAKTENMHFALYGRNPGSDTASRMMTLLEHLIIKGVRLSFFSELADCLAGAGVRHLPGEVFASGEDLPADVDIFLSLGGDGTFLSSLTMVGRRGIPVAGINFGRLGFLTSAGSGDAGCGIVDRMIAGDYGVRERSLLLSLCAQRDHYTALRPQYDRHRGIYRRDAHTDLLGGRVAHSDPDRLYGLFSQRGRPGCGAGLFGLHHYPDGSAQPQREAVDSA